MTIHENQLLGPLNKIRSDDIELLYKKTLIAIIVISSAYITGIIFFTALFLLKSDYCYTAFLFPLLAYLWLISFGAKYVNNHYGLKKTLDGTLVYIKKRQSYSTFVTIHILIFLVTSIVRLVCEINNLLLMRQELYKNRICKDA